MVFLSVCQFYEARERGVRCKVGSGVYYILSSVKHEDEARQM